MERPFNSKVYAEETVDMRRTLRDGTVTHELVSRATADVLLLGVPDEPQTATMRIQSLDKYLEEIKKL